MMLRACLIAALAVAAVVSTAGDAPAARAQDGRLRVVATFSILGDIVQNVGGDAISLRTLIGANGDTHTYEPTPADARALADADLVFENGLAFESWLPDLYRSSRSRATRVAVTDDLAPLRAAADGHRHGEFDPHMWHEVSNAIAMTDTVRDALVRADPANRDAYFLNAAVYTSFLVELDGWIFGQVNRLPAERRRLITAHNSFDYFARRYGFEILGSAIGSVSTEAEPSARQIAALVDVIRGSGVPAIFPENVTNPRLMQRLADEAGVALAPPLYSDALGGPGSGADTYVGLMRTNVTTIVAALSR